MLLPRIAFRFEDIQEPFLLRSTGAFIRAFSLLRVCDLKSDGLSCSFTKLASAFFEC